MRTRLWLIAALASGMLIAAPAGAKMDRSSRAGTGNMTTNKQLAEPDRTFLTEVAQGNAAEIQMAQLALKKTESAGVRKAAQTILKDHLAAGKSLVTLARKRGLSLPAGPDSLHKGTYASLSKASGKDFDNQYVSAQMQDHKATIDLFKREIKQSSDAGIRTFARRTLPHLQVHAILLAKAAQELKAVASSGGKTRNSSM